MSTLMPLRFRDGATSFDLFVAADSPGEFEQSQIVNRPISDLAKLGRALLRGRGSFVDIGANIGTVCVPVALSGSRTLAIELLPENCLRLLLAVRANGLSSMRVLQCAATSVDGLVNFGGHEAGGHVTERSDRQAVGLTLDTIVALTELAEPAFLQTPLLVKIDVEGHESEVLKGSAETIRERRPLVVFESIEPADAPPGLSREAKVLLVDYGYEFFAIRTDVLAPRGVTDVQESLVTDFLAVPSETRDWCPADYAVRPLTEEESVAWLLETSTASDLHRRHAESALARMPEWARAAARGALI